MTTVQGQAKSGWKRRLRKSLREHWVLYALLSVPFALVIVFNYVPMVGVVMAFQKYRPNRGIFRSEWVGLYHFQRFLKMPMFWQLLRNTLLISLYGLAAGFPMPILLALGLKEMRGKRLRKTIQLVTYAPYFISTVVMVGMLYQLLDYNNGLVNSLLGVFGVPNVNFFGELSMFRSIYVWSGVWQGTGYGAVLYLAAISGIDPQLYEAAVIDGANKARRVWHIDLPGIAPTIIIQLIFSMGGLLSVGYEKIYLMQNSLNVANSEVISTYVYKTGLEEAQYGFAAAVGLFNSVVNFVILALVNWVARRVGDTSLW